MKRTLRSMITVYVVVFVLSAWMVVRAQESYQRECNSATGTCVALLAQKTYQIDTHLTNTDVTVKDNIRDINTKLDAINTAIIQIQSNESWERAIWGTIVALISAGSIGFHIYNKRSKDV